jgi:hypothetical protein
MNSTVLSLTVTGGGKEPRLPTRHRFDAHVLLSREQLPGVKFIFANLPRCSITSLVALASLPPPSTLVPATSLNGTQQAIPKFPFYTNKVHLPTITLSPALQFRRFVFRMIYTAMQSTTDNKLPEDDPDHKVVPTRPPPRPGLRRIAPYWHPYATMAKERWYGREILEVISSEFRDRSVEYYVRFPSKHPV